MEKVVLGLLVDELDFIRAQGFKLGISVALELAVESILNSALSFASKRQSGSVLRRDGIKYVRRGMGKQRALH